MVIENKHNTRVLMYKKDNCLMKRTTDFIVSMRIGQLSDDYNYYYNYNYHLHHFLNDGSHWLPHAQLAAHCCTVSKTESIDMS